MRYRQFQKKPPRRSLFAETLGLAGGIVAIGVAGFFIAGDEISSAVAFARSCDIKGNISINSREKIFHVSGQEDYAATRISLRYGERWFCTEDEARAAGWRKARN